MQAIDSCTTDSEKQNNQKRRNVTTSTRLLLQYARKSFLSLLFYIFYLCSFYFLCNILNQETMITLLLFCLFPFTWADVISTSSIQCDCGFQDNLSTTWSDVWHMNFQNRPSPSNLYAIHDLFFANYIIDAKYNDSYARIFHKENVNTLEDAIQIAITVNQTSNEITCGGFGTTR